MYEFSIGEASEKMLGTQSPRLMKVGALVFGVLECWPIASCAVGDMTVTRQVIVLLNLAIKAWLVHSLSGSRSRGKIENTLLLPKGHDPVKQGSGTGV